MRFNLADHCLLRHLRDPGLARATALILVRPGAPDEAWTFSELGHAAREVARGLLGLGLARGDRVLLRLENSADYAAVFFGAVRAGLVPMPSSPMLTPEEVTFLLRDSGAAAIVTEAKLAAGIVDDAEVTRGVRHVVLAGAEALEASGGPRVHRLGALRDLGGAADLPDTDAEEPAFLIYTSGTTARPKGVLHAQRSAVGRAIVIREWEGLSPGDRVCHAGALNWTYTLGVGLMDPLSVGATAVLCAGAPEPASLPPLIERLGVTVFAAVPTVYRQILKYAEVERVDWSSLRHGLSAGEPLPASVHREWTARVGTPIYEALGMSEISTYVSFRPGMEVKPGAAGRPQAGRRVRLLAMDSEGEAAVGHVGRIAVHRSDPGLMLRYWNAAEEDLDRTEGEWFISGDLAIRDEEGVLWFQGRDDDLVKSLGYRVSPVEVEAVLAAHEAVVECAVTAAPTGEPGLDILTAFVKTPPGVPLDPAGLDAHCRAHLASYKCPKAYLAVDALPRTANGKLLRRALLGRARGSPEAPGGFAPPPGGRVR